LGREIAEHSFGALKARMGATHILMQRLRNFLLMRQ